MIILWMGSFMRFLFIKKLLVSLEGKTMFFFFFITVFPFFNRRLNLILMYIFLNKTFIPEQLLLSIIIKKIHFKGFVCVCVAHRQIYWAQRSENVVIRRRI